MSQSPKVPDLLLEKMILGELEPEKEKQVRARLDKELGGQKRLEELRESNREILDEYMPEQIAASIRQKVELESPNKPRQKTVWSPAPALALAVAVIALVVLTALPFIDDKNTTGTIGIKETVRIKGDPRLFIHLKTADGTREIVSGDTVSPGDKLQLSYLAGDAKFGMVVSIDGNDSVTLHFPLSPEADAALAGGGTVSLPFSYELDAAPDFERFFFISSKNPMEVEMILAQMKLDGGDPIENLKDSGTMKIIEILLHKPEK